MKEMPDKEKVIKCVHDARRYLEDREWVDKSVGVHIDALNDALELLKEQDCNCCGTVFDVAYKAGKADAVVRCKDCKHYTGGLDGYCDKLFRKTGGEMWFCADGERKDNTK